MDGWINEGFQNFHKREPKKKKGKIGSPEVLKMKPLKAKKKKKKAKLIRALEKGKGIIHTYTIAHNMKY